MSKFTTSDVSGHEGADFGVASCRYHRCKDHSGPPQLNQTEATGAECGGCLAQEVWLLDRRTIPDILDGFAEYLTDHARLTHRLHEAYLKLDLMAAGAGADLRKRQLADEMRRIAKTEQDDQLRKMPPIGEVS